MKYVIILLAAVAAFVLTGADYPENNPLASPDWNDPLADYTIEDITCITNMVYGEISVIAYDSSYTEGEQNLVMQQWARVPVNHVSMGLADSIPELMRATTAGGYYIWNPAYAKDYDGFKLFMEYSRGSFEEELYERCRVNTLIALAECMDTPLPEDVIYADLQPHGPVYAVYPIDTGYFRSTVYLSCDGRAE